MSEIKKTTLHPDNQPNIDLYPKTSADQVESLDARITALSTHIYKVSIDLPKGAQNGNITQSQLNILQASEFNCIEMINDKELYYLNDPGHEEGFLTYSHVGIENGKATIKTLTITVSAMSFVIVTTVVSTESGGSGKVHHITLSDTNKLNFIKFTCVSNKDTLSLQDALEYIPDGSGDLYTNAKTIAVTFGYLSYVGACACAKTDTTVYITGSFYNFDGNTASPLKKNFIVTDIVDVVLTEI